MSTNTGSSRRAYQHRFIRLSDLTLHLVEMEGHGDPLFALHGIGMDWRVWQAVSRRLLPHFRLYLLDLRGHGESDKPASGYTVAHYAADVEDLLDTLSLNHVVLLGSSLGGVVATAVEAPSDIVTHRILVDPPLTGGPIRDEQMFRDILRLKRRPQRELADYLADMNPGSSRHLMNMMSQMWHEAADGVILDMLEQPRDYFNVDQALRADESQTMIMQASPDLGGALTDEQAQRAVGLLRHGELRKFGNAGHAIHAYQPKEFAGTVVDFVRQTEENRVL